MLRHITRAWALILILSAPALLRAEDPIAFTEVTAEANLATGLVGLRGHAAAWGDVNADGWPELYLGVFCTPEDGPEQSNRLFVNRGGRFVLDEQAALRVRGRASGAVFADLDGDGDLELFVANEAGFRTGVQGEPSHLFRNDGDGQFSDVSEASGICGPGVSGRSVAVLDHDHDGRLDLLLAEDPWFRRAHNRLYANRGELRFADAGRTAGMPARMPGLGIAVADVNNDGWPDFFVAARGRSNALYLGSASGRFSAAELVDNPFIWDTPTRLDTPAGVCFGDLNRDGRMDLVVGQHYQQPWRKPRPIRIFLNMGSVDGRLQFREITEEAGLLPLTMKAPHIEIQDLDNDGWPDIIASAVRYVDGRPVPLVYRHRGLEDGVPRFTTDWPSINAYPTAEDRAIEDSAEFYAKMIADRRVTYMAPGPCTDFDRDGRMDIFLLSWWPELPSHLLRNTSAAGNWLQVEVAPVPGTAPMGIGAKVSVYESGRAGEAAALIGYREIAVGYGYTSGQEAFVHVGLGERETCDVVITYPGVATVTQQSAIAVNRRIRILPDGSLETRTPSPATER